MTQTMEARQVSPTLFFESMNAYQRSAALKAAIDLDLFTAIGEGIETIPELAQRCGAAERGMRILCDYLAIGGFLTKAGSLYGLTPESAAFLDRRSPACIASAARFLASPMLTDGFKDLAASVRKGGTILDSEGHLAPDHPIWVEFAQAMAPLMTLPAELIAGLLAADLAPKWKVLDIAAGHGVFGIALAKHNPRAEVVAVDWANVLEAAKANAREAGVAERYRTIPGSAFEVEFGTGYDIVLLTNFLHHFDVATCETVLRKVHKALGPEGRAVTLEFVPNEDRISPPVAASFSLIMLGGTPSGDAYTFSEFERMFRNSGFSSSELHQLPPTFEQVIISHR
jgi:ubiquinone/menaquinone biosynthesis C-methylase UbiE